MITLVGATHDPVVGGFDYPSGVGFWSWIFGGDAPRAAPAWSGIHSPEAFERFAGLVMETLRAEGHEVTPAMVRSGSIVLGAGGDRREWMLHALASRCADLPEARWSGQIAASLGQRTGRSDDHEDEPPSVTAKEGRRKKRKRRSPDEARLKMSSPLEPGALRVQLMSTAYVSMVDPNERMSTPLAEGIERVLVAVLPGSEITLRRADVAHLGHSDDTLFRGAILNAVTTEADQIVETSVRADDGTVVSILVSNGFFMGGCVLRLLEEAPSAHVIVCFLTWHHVLLHFVEAPPSLAALELLFSLAERLDEEVAVGEAERLSTNVFCYDRALARYTRLEIARDADGGVTSVSPDTGLAWTRRPKTGSSDA